MPRLGTRLLLPALALALAGTLGTGVTTAATTAATAAASAPDHHRGHPRPTTGPLTYHNPLAPTIPGDGTVDSCADPTVLRGQRPAEQGSWFMYCTTDPLNDQDVDAAGDLRFHPIPTMRSDDLVHWTYVGDALPDPPSWAADGAGLWAPDVVYSRRTDRYYLSFVVTDTDDSLRGPDACPSTGDNAIGVAVGRTPTGPWQVADKPLVGPRPDPNADCGFFWTFDPDVLGNAVGGHSVLYYGSYYGGVQASRIRFDTAGADLVGDPTQVVVGNRFEGTNVVQRHGWYWLFGSATNCCNGPLTAYGVFAGRSRSPFGPFRDRDGHSLLAGRAGGTPVLQINGNRWMGPGHNSVFTDAAGRWWTVYHAVDRRDPYFATDPGFTRRPAMLDPLDWVHGWPTVRGGRGASDRTMPAPATDPDRPSRYRPHAAPRLHLGRPLPAYSDDFRTGLDPAWQWTREPAPETWGVEHGALRFDTQAGDLYVDTNSASVLSRPAPPGDYVVQTRVRLDVPKAGCCQNFVQAGIVLRAAGTEGDDRFVKLVHASLWETRQTEWAKEVPHAPAGYPRYGNGVVGPPGDVTWLRIAVDRRPGPDRFTAYTHADSGHWVRGGTWTHDLGTGSRIGLVSMGGSGFTARFLDVRTWRPAR